MYSISSNTFEVLTLNNWYYLMLIANRKNARRILSVLETDSIKQPWIQIHALVCETNLKAKTEIIFMQATHHKTNINLFTASTS